MDLCIPDLIISTGQKNILELKICVKTHYSLFAAPCKVFMVFLIFRPAPMEVTVAQKYHSI